MSLLLVFSLPIFSSFSSFEPPLPAPDFKHSALNASEFKDLTIEQKTVKPRDLSRLLEKYDLTDIEIANIESELNISFRPQELRVRDYFVLSSKDDRHRPQYLIFDPTLRETLVIQLSPTVGIRLIRKKTVWRPMSTSGVIDSALWPTLLESGVRYPHELIRQMEEALEYEVDLYHLESGDEFKLIYDEEYVQEHDAPVGAGKLRALYLRTKGQDYYAYHFENKGYYNQLGQSMKGMFLRTPIKYARISSPYNLRRKHPVTGKVQAHMGTDYAAPKGTPIHSVADGVVTRAGFNKFNGHYVFIEHDDQYKTGYLHLNHFPADLRIGDTVKQGQVIGYVGSTGLASGPHVCFRFWKNGRQIDHLTERFPPVTAFPNENSAEFFFLRDSMRAALDEIMYF